MANVKEICITCEVPFDWIGRLPDNDAAFLARVLLEPCTGMMIENTETRYLPNGGGGRTSMYKVTIFGTEALAWPAIERIAELMNRSSIEFIEQGKVVKQAKVEAYDLEDVVG